MPLRPTSIADLDICRRWNLADDAIGPTSLPKMLFPEDEARRLGEARSRMFKHPENMTTLLAQKKIRRKP